MRQSASQGCARVRVGGVALDEGAAERLQPISRGRARPQRRGTRRVRLLELGLRFGEEGEQEAVTVAEPAKERPLSDAGRLRDLVHRHVLGAPLGHQPGGHLQQPGTVAGGVGPFAGGTVRCPCHGSVRGVARTHTYTDPSSIRTG